MNFTLGSLSTLLLTLFWVYWPQLAAWMGLAIIIATLVAAIATILVLITIGIEFAQHVD